MLRASDPCQHDQTPLSGARSADECNRALRQVPNLPHDSTCVDLAASGVLAYTPRSTSSHAWNGRDRANYCGPAKPAEWSERIIHIAWSKALSLRALHFPWNAGSPGEWSPDSPALHPAHPPRAQQTGTGGYRPLWVTADRPHADCLWGQCSAFARSSSATDRSSPTRIATPG